MTAQKSVDDGRRSELSMEDLVRLVGRNADRFELADLVARYGLAVDNRDLDELSDLYTSDGVFAGNAIGTSSGTQAILDYFRDRWTRTEWTNHFTHTQLVDFITDDEATGYVTGHAELVFDDTLIVAANRYHDHYVRENGRWRFRERRVRMLYLMPIADLPTHFADAKRKRWPGTPPESGELPEPADAYPRFREAIRAGR